MGVALQIHIAHEIWIGINVEMENEIYWCVGISIDGQTKLN